MTREIHISTKQQRVGRFLMRANPTMFEELLAQASVELEGRGDPVKKAKRDATKRERAIIRGEAAVTSLDPQSSPIAQLLERIRA